MHDINFKKWTNDELYQVLAKIKAVLHQRSTMNFGSFSTTRPDGLPDGLINRNKASDKWK